jgi:predicted nucleotidyltransferase
LKMLKAYASYFASYLLANLKNIENVRSIILFGSVARGEATKGSDADIFIEVKKASEKFTKDAEKVLDGFYKSREALLFKAKGIENKISMKIGKLDEWRNLKQSIESTGIVLYGKYTSGRGEGKKYAVIFWSSIGKNRGAFLNKIYGFKVKNKDYKGILEKFNGKKIGKSAIMMPVEHREEITKLLKHHDVDAKIMDVYS